MSFPNIMTHNFSEWYRLGLNENNQLVVTIFGPYSRELMTLQLSAPIIEFYQKTLKLGPFQQTPDSWGFDGILSHQEIDANARGFCVPFPEILNGGKYIDPMAGIAICASLWTLLFYVLTPHESTLGAANHLFPYQLITVDDMAVSQDGGGGSIVATVSKQLCSWISKSTTECSLEALAATMTHAYRQMWPDNLHAKREMMVVTSPPNWLSLHCHGDRCDLTPKEHYLDNFEAGFRLVPHNMDTQMQTIAMLVGLAAVCDMARKDGY